MYTLLGFLFVCWLLVSPGWRVFAIKRRNEDGVRTQVNHWLLTWFALSLLAPVFWMWLYKGTCMSNQHRDKNQVVCPWREMDTYMLIVLIVAVVSNLIWLVRLCFIDLKKTLLYFGITVAGACTLVIMGTFQLGIYDCWGRLRLAGYIAIALGVAATICRMMSMERQEFSFFALSVALSAVLPELMWILNVIFVEQFTKYGKDCGFFEVFFVKNFYWKLSWTLNSLFRLPELINLIRQIDAERRIQWRREISIRARRFLGTAVQG